MRKKWNLLTIIMLAGLSLAVLVMCNSDRMADSRTSEGLPSFGQVITLPSVGDSIDLNSVTSDTANTVMTVDLDVYEGTQFSNYKIVLKSLQPQDMCDGWEAMVQNSSQTDTLWTYTFEWDCDDSTWFRISEEADGDFISMEIEEDGDSIIETTIQDGDTLVLKYDSDLYDGIHGDTSKYSSSEKAVIDSLEDDFADFYDTTTAINDNDDGLLMIELLDSDDFWEWMYDRMYDNPAHDHPRALLSDVLDDYCSQHHMCPIKCGDSDHWTNPGCWECIFSYVVCSLYDFLKEVLE